MQSLNRKALLVFLALLVLDLLVRLWASRGTSRPVGVENLTMDPDQVSALEILSGKERLILERTPQGFEWKGAGKESPDPKAEEKDIQSREAATSARTTSEQVKSRNPLIARKPLTAREKQAEDVTSRGPLFSTQAQEGETILRKPLTATQTQAVETFLKRICSMVREPVGELAEERLSAYGFDPEQEVSIRLHWQNTTRTKRPFTVRFGTSLPLNVMYVYASFSDTPGLFKVLRTYRESAVTLLRSMAP